MSYQRILSEWKEINQDGLSLNHPFRQNDTTEVSSCFCFQHTVTLLV